MEFNKYGPRSHTETAAIWLQEVLLMGVAAFVVVFAVGVISHGAPASKHQAQLNLPSERTGSLLNEKGPELGPKAN